ncbi:MAG: hypothetical protein MJZ77_03595 [Bacteroidales bacterium]|nr:hypothetical protein [Bacteroidales bacterium]
MDNNCKDQNDNIPIEFLPDFKICYSKKELEDLDMELSEKESELLNMLSELQSGTQEKHDVLKDLLEVAKKGALDYLDSFTDTSDTISENKNPNSVRKLNTTEIDKKCKPTTNQEKMDNWQPRTIGEANKSPFDKNSATSTKGMSAEGASRFERYEKVYSQRIKSIRAVSTDDNSIQYKQDSNANYESLAALRGYRIGPVVSMYSKGEIKQMYEAKKAQSDSFDNVSSWLAKENFDKFDDQLVKEFGFANRAQATKWRKDNNLTIHEGPDGMFLVPSDIHDAASHAGYRSEMQKYLKGEISDEELRRWELQDKVSYVGHEMSVRGIRMMKGIGLSVIKDVLKSSIAIIVEETICEFKRKCEDKFVMRISRLCKACLEHIKTKCKDIINNIKKNIAGSITSEALNMLVDMLKNFLFSTAKNIIKIIRTMWSSIIQAVKTIFNKESTWSERIFEASKILTAGFVGVVGFSLNELLEKGLTSIGIPFASFISECLSGLFASIMSALVFMIFDNIKGHFKAKSIYSQQSILETQILFVNSARIDISTLRTNMAVSETFQFFSDAINNMQRNFQHIEEEKAKGEEKSRIIKSHIENNHKQNEDAYNRLKVYEKDDKF